MEGKKSKKKFLGIPVPGSWPLKKSDTFASSNQDDEQNSAPSSKVRSAAASSYQADDPDNKSIYDSNLPAVVPIYSPLRDESRTEHHQSNLVEPEREVISLSRPESPHGHQLRQSVDMEATYTPTTETAITPQDWSSGPWAKAYTRLQFKVNETVTQYESRLSSYISPDANDHLSSSVLSQADRIIISNQVLHHWLERWGTHVEDPSEEDDFEAITSLKEAVKHSLVLDAEAAIAWGALPIVIQSVRNTPRLPHAAIDTLEYITARLEWYCGLVRLVQTPPVSDLAEAEQCDLGQRIDALYEAILAIFLEAASFDIHDRSLADAKVEEFYSAEKRLPLSNNYRVTHLFLSPSDRLEEAGTDFIPEIENRTEEGSQDRSSEYLDKLHATDQSNLIANMENGRAEIFSSALENACKISEFASLFNETSDPVEALCVHGSPGTGKTMLLLAVIWNASQQDPERMFNGHVSYFICGDYFARSGTIVLKNLISQVLRKQPNLCHYLNEQFKLTEREDFDDPEDISAMSFVFFRIVSDPTFEPTLFVVDSLDQGTTGNSFLRLISTSIQLSSSKARWLFSVDEFDRTSIQDEGPHLHIRHMSLDAYGAACLVSSRQYASFLVKQLPKHMNICDGTCEALIEGLSQGSNGNYLRMDLACRAVAAADPWNADELLQSLPREIEDLWVQRKEIIENLEWHTPDYCAKVLDVMAVVYRPLHLTELADLVNIPAGTFLRGVVEKCVCLLEIRKNMVFFTCAAAKAFIRKTSSPSPISHAQMAQKCLDSISKISNPVPEDAPESGHYASVYWMNHLAENDVTKWDYCTLDSVAKFARNNTVEWLDRLVEDECLAHALTQARNLELVLSEESKHIDGGVALLQLIQDVHQLLSVAASGVADSNDPGVSFYPSQDVMNQHLRRGGYPTLSVPLPQRDRSLVHALQGHTDWVRSCAFSPDAQLIASASDDYTVRIWNTRTGKMQHVFDDFKNWIYTVAWSSGNLLAAMNGDKISVLDMDTGERKAILDTESECRVKSLAFSADGTKLAAATGSYIVLWSIPSFDRMTIPALTVDDDVEHVEFAVTNNQLLSMSQSCATIWDLENGEAIRKADIDDETFVYAGSISPGGDYVALATGPELKLKTIDDQSIFGTPVNMAAPISALAFAADGKYLAAASEDGDIKIFDPWSGRTVQTLKGHSRPVYKVSFSSSGQHLISCSSDRSLRVWRIESESSGQLENYEEGHLQPITCLELSPDGGSLVSASEDQTICLWDGRNGTLKCKRDHDESAALSLQFSHDGNRLVTGGRDGGVRLWDISHESMTFVHRFEGHGDWVRSVVFAPDGNWIASGSDDKSVLLWNVVDPTTKPIALEVHSDYVRSVAFSPDGVFLASGGDDRHVMIWDTNATIEAHEARLWKVLGDLSSMVAATVFTFDGSQLVASLFDSKIAIWDTKTWSRRTVEVSHLFRTLRVIPDEDMWLETEIGAICLQPERLARKSDLPSNCPFGISRDGWWITYEGEKRVFFLPEAFRPDDDEKSTLVRGDRIVIGCLSGQVLLLNFEK